MVGHVSTKYQIQQYYPFLLFPSFFLTKHKLHSLLAFFFGGSIFQSFHSTIFGFFHEFFR
jgi:hypothetical protein